VRTKQGSEGGFTLIELIMVIVILGILAAFAAPRFSDLSSEANEAVLEGLGSAMLGGARLVYAKAVIQNVQAEANATVDLDGDGTDDTRTVFGYPRGDRFADGIANAVELGNDWAYGHVGGAVGTALHVTRSALAGFSGPTNNNINITKTNCYLTYTPPTTFGLSPVITYRTTGC